MDSLKSSALFVWLILFVTSHVIVLAYDDTPWGQMGMPTSDGSSHEVVGCQTEECQARRREERERKKEFALVQSLNGILSKLNMSGPPTIDPFYKDCLDRGGKRVTCAQRMQEIRISNATTPAQTTPKPSRGTVKVEPEEGNSQNSFTSI